jgi:hypothetical protein
MHSRLLRDHEFRSERIDVRTERAGVSEEAGYPRFAERGRTFVYVLPCRDEDVLKVGFSRDPLERFRTLHSRFFDFFDLDRGLLIETGHLRDARRVERLFITAFREHQALAPLVIPVSAAGYTEWYRGIDAAVGAMARDLCAENGFPLHAPLRPWLRQRLEAWSDRLFQWSAGMLEVAEYEYFNALPTQSTRRVERSMREILDAYEALGLDVTALVPPAVADWYRDEQFFARRR